MTDDAPTLPGLEPPTPGASPLEVAVRTTLDQLAKDGRIEAVRDAGKCALAIELAQVIAIKRRSGRASTVGNDARVLMEILDSFTADDDGADANAELAKAMREWEAALDGT